MFKSRDRSWIEIQHTVTQERTVYTHQLFGKSYENVFGNELPINYRTFSTNTNVKNFWLPNISLHIIICGMSYYFATINCSKTVSYINYPENQHTI